MQLPVAVSYLDAVGRSHGLASERQGRLQIRWQCVMALLDAKRNVLGISAWTRNSIYCKSHFLPSSHPSRRGNLLARLQNRIYIRIDRPADNTRARLSTGSTATGCRGIVESQTPGLTGREGAGKLPAAGSNGSSAAGGSRQLPRTTSPAAMTCT